MHIISKVFRFVSCHSLFFKCAAPLLPTFSLTPPVGHAGSIFPTTNTPIVCGIVTAFPLSLSQSLSISLIFICFCPCQGEVCNLCPCPLFVSVPAREKSEISVHVLYLFLYKTGRTNVEILY